MRQRSRAKQYWGGGCVLGFVVVPVLQRLGEGASFGIALRGPAECALELLGSPLFWVMAITVSGGAVVELAVRGTGNLLGRAVQRVEDYHLELRASARMRRKRDGGLVPAAAPPARGAEVIAFTGRLCWMRGRDAWRAVWKPGASPSWPRATGQRRRSKRR